MALPLGAAIGGAATLLGGLAANRSSAKSAERATRASAEEAAKSRVHQLYMSNTAYQRAKSDLSVAGYNPILGMFQGGASTGSGASAAGVASKYDNVGESASNSALATRRLSADLDKIKADTSLSEAMRHAQDADVLLKNASTAKTLAEAKKLGFDTSKSEFWSSLYKPAGTFVGDVKEMAANIDNRLPEGKGPVNKRTGKKERTLQQRVNAHYSLTSGRK